jgi:hypothetical protein
MRYKIAIKRKVLLAVFITFLIIMASGLPSAEASDSKATFTVQ